MTEHTPGPWSVSGPDRHPDNCVWIMGADGLSILAMDNYNPADACLIAAAPTMLDALKLALDALYDYGDSSVVGQIEAAINLARGIGQNVDVTA